MNISRIIFEGIQNGNIYIENKLITKMAVLRFLRVD